MEMVVGSEKCDPVCFVAWLLKLQPRFVRGFSVRSGYPPKLHPFDQIRVNHAPNQDGGIPNQGVRTEVHKAMGFTLDTASR